MLSNFFASSGSCDRMSPPMKMLSRYIHFLCTSIQIWGRTTLRQRRRPGRAAQHGAGSRRAGGSFPERRGEGGSTAAQPHSEAPERRALHTSPGQGGRFRPSSGLEGPRDPGALACGVCHATPRRRPKGTENGTQKQLSAGVHGSATRNSQKGPSVNGGETGGAHPRSGPRLGLQSDGALAPATTRANREGTVLRGRRGTPRAPHCVVPSPGAVRLGNAHRQKTDRRALGPEGGAVGSGRFQRVGVCI